MRIRLEQVRDEPFRFEETVDLDAATLGHPDLESLSPIAWRGEVVFTDPGWLFTATYEYEQTLPCYRCLEPLTQPVRGGIQLLFILGAAEPRMAERELGEQDLNLVYLADDEVDLGPFLVEQLQLNVPMKPLCREGCQGLCPTCGADLNAGPCRCPGEEPDPRWKGLEALRERLDDKG
jgi:uncharacterized protein